MKRIWSLLLSLCLCAGVAFPAFPALAADGDIRPYTISGNFFGEPFSVTFSAAKARKATVTQIFDDGPEENFDYDEDEEASFDDASDEEFPIQTRQVSVTVLTLCPGSVIRINEGLEYDDEEPFVSAITGRKDSDGFHMYEQEVAYIHAGLAEWLSWGYQDEDSGETYQYGYFLYTLDLSDEGEVYLLELGDTPAPASPDGYRAFSFQYFNGEEDIPYTFAFTEAKAETRSVTLRHAIPEQMLGEGDGINYEEYSTIRATVIKVKAGSVSRVFTEDETVYLLPGEIDEQGRYTIYSVRPNGRMYWEDTEFLNGRVDHYLRLGRCDMPYDPSGNHMEESAYLIQLDDACPFEDVKLSDYYAQPVLWAVNRGVTNGTSATMFSPHNTCSRAQILTFIWRYCGEPEPTVSNPFRDVSADNYYYKAALWAYERGMVSGATFNGGSACTRAETMKCLWILAGRPESGNPSFTDVSPSADYAKAVAWAVAQGVTKGTSDTTFSPDNTCTRGQIVTFLYRLYTK